MNYIENKLIEFIKKIVQEQIDHGEHGDQTIISEGSRYIEELEQIKALKQAQNKLALAAQRGY